MKVSVEIEEVVLQSEEGRDIDGVVARCTRCDHQTESFGTSDKSIKRCLVLLREECPNDEMNFYVDEDE